MQQSGEMQSGEMQSRQVEQRDGQLEIDVEWRMQNDDVERWQRDEETYSRDMQSREMSQSTERCRDMQTDLVGDVVEQSDVE